MDALSLPARARPAVPSWPVRLIINGNGVSVNPKTAENDGGGAGLGARAGGRAKVTKGGPMLPETYKNCQNPPILCAYITVSTETVKKSTENM